MLTVDGRVAFRDAFVRKFPRPECGERARVSGGLHWIFSAGVASLFGCSSIFAQQFPSKPLRLIVPLAPGGGNDGAARIVGHRLGEALGEQVIVDNRPGGGSIIASELMLKAPPDGHTLYLVSTVFTVA